MDKKMPILMLSFLFLLVLCTSNSFAVSPFTPQTGGELVIEAPKLDYFQAGSYGFRAYTHVYNSTGFPMTNATTTCELHVFNRSAQSVFHGNSSFDGDMFFFTLPDSIMTIPGEYAFIVDCENHEAGFVSGVFQVAYNSDTSTQLPVGISIILAIFFTFILFVAGYFTIKKHPLSYLFVLLGFFMADVLIWLNWRILSFQASPIANVFYTIFLAMCLITFVMGVVTFLDLLRLATKMHDTKEAKKNLDRFGYN